MNSYPRIESLPDLTEEDGTEEELIVAALDDEADCQQVDSFRIARFSRAQARWEGALSEAAHRVGDKA
jgi:hypothetical protein